MYDQAAASKLPIDIAIKMLTGENNLLKNSPEFNSGNYAQEPGAQDRGHTSQPTEIDLWRNDNDDEFHLT